MQNRNYDYPQHSFVLIQNLKETIKLHAKVEIEQLNKIHFESQKKSFRLVNWITKLRLKKSQIRLRLFLTKIRSFSHKFIGDNWKFNLQRLKFSWIAFECVECTWKFPSKFSIDFYGRQKTHSAEVAGGAVDYTLKHRPHLNVSFKIFHWYSAEKM